MWQAILTAALCASSMAVGEPMGGVCGWSVPGLMESGEGFWLLLPHGFGEAGIGPMDFVFFFSF